MSFCKRAPALRAALWLGLFFHFTLPVEAQENPAPVALEVSAKANTLWVEDDGAAVYWQSGLSFTLGNCFFMGFDLGKVSSSLSWMDTSLFGFVGHCGFDTPWAGFTVAVGLLDNSPVSAAMDKLPISNDGGDGFFISIKAPLYFGPFSVTPYLLSGQAFWDDGDLYWFFGKPKLPSLLIYGADFSLDQQDRYQHTLRAYGFSAGLEINSNENEPLFDVDLDAGLFSYQFSMEWEQFLFTGTLGWFFARASLDGSLNSSNQPYFLFPFLNYDVSGSLKIHAGFAHVGFRYTRGIFCYNINLGAFQILSDQVEARIHYQEKKLFGGNERSEDRQIEMGKTGAAFLLLDAGLVLPLAANKNQKLSLGLQKAFFLPWGYETWLPSAAASSGGSSGTGGSSGSGGATLSLVKTILLSGLSIRGSLRW